MEWLSYMDIGLLKITGKVMICLPVLESYLIMNLNAEGKSLLQEKLQTLWLKLNLENKNI